MDENAKSDPAADSVVEGVAEEAGAKRPVLPKEVGGPAGPEPTRFGDWEQKGRCTDF